MHSPETSWGTVPTKSSDVSSPERGMREIDMVDSCVVTLTLETSICAS